MDTGEGRFVELESLEYKIVNEMRNRFPKSKGIFTISEELEIKGSKFKVKEITPFGIRLKLLKCE
jgi:hypothetical protein